MSVAEPDTTQAPTEEPAASPALRKGTPAHRQFLRRRRRQQALVNATRIVILIAFVGLWQYGADQRWWDPLLTSTPARVWETFLSMVESGGIWEHTWVTLKETMISFAVGMAGGTLIAVGIWWSTFLARVLDPYLVVLNALPKIALGPILYVWLGPTLSIYGMAIAISLIVTVIMVATGFLEVDADKVKLLRTFGADRRQILQKVVLPASVPTLVATMKVCLGLTLVGVIVGEFLAARSGLGYLILYGSQVFQMSLVMTSIVVLAIMSAALYLAVVLIETMVLRRRSAA